ncbi:DUF2280 domain-containing protein [Psychrobacter sp. JB193]|uniref:DUF2280 domain-containing protein n=1 Tax=Psychrobacter sp. JB193 TaxID=2024406 RepID=UPI000BAABEDA|nr:DUF2280 domain-containing protein [Psychrobacter sp. JB193]PAT63942.1 hypothetical protein CIK80_02190 [Psychrobacter sp. JB193]
MSTLTNEVKAFIVQGLATYMTPTQVAEAVLDEFDITITRQTVARHDPTKVAGKDVGQEWVDLFNESRKAFQEDLQAIPIANKAYRMTVLNRMTVDAEKQKNRPLVASLLEQAAKEMGEVFTNKQKVDNVSSDGSMSPPQPLTPDAAQAISKDLDDEY